MQNKIEKINKVIAKILKDTKVLQKQGMLTERGKGQQDTALVIKQILARNYTEMGSCHSG